MRAAAATPKSGRRSITASPTAAGGGAREGRLSRYLVHAFPVKEPFSPYENRITRIVYVVMCIDRYHCKNLVRM